MTFDKAIKILGLNKSFSEEELKQAHRKLAQLHHPDIHENSEDRLKEEEIMKDINAAKDLLMKHLKNNNHENRTYSAYNNIYIEENRKTKLKELQKIVSKDFITEFVSQIGDLSVMINTIFNTLEAIPMEFYTRACRIKINLNINALYKEYLNKIKYIFKELEKQFYRENYINIEDIKESINYDCTLKDFCEQLLKIKDKYSKEVFLKKKLEDELLKYTYFAGYEIIEKQIKEIIRNFTSKIKKQRFKYNQQDIDDINKEITDLFKKFFSLKQKIETLEQKVKQMNDEEIKEQFELIKNNLYSGYPFDTFDEKISELEEQIETYVKETKLKNIFKENEQAINDIYKNLIERYSLVAQGYNIINYPSAVDEINQQLKELLQLFTTGCSQYKDLEFFNLFKEITFKSFSNDYKITRKIKNMAKGKKSNVYIKINTATVKDEYSFFWFDEENMTMYRFCTIGTINSEKINYQQLTEDYIVLEDFLEQSTFIGKYKMKKNTEVVGIIYEGFGYSIYLEKDKFFITKDMGLMKTSNRNNEYLNRFKDKKYVYDMIEEQLREMLEKHKKKSTLTGYQHHLDYIAKNLKTNKNIYGDIINKYIYGDKEYNDTPGKKIKR